MSSLFKFNGIDLLLMELSLMDSVLMDPELFDAGMAEGAIFAAGAVKLLDRLPFDMRVLFNNHLTYTVTIVDGKILFAEIDQYNADFATIVGIYGAGTVGNRYSMIQSQSGTRPDLTFVALGQLHI